MSYHIYVAKNLCLNNQDHSKSSMINKYDLFFCFVKDCINYIEGKKLNQMFILNFLYFHDKLDAMEFNISIL